eukprot:scaffold89820_cov38-Prasinocladus_malaysianus.AAC.1
MQNWHIPLLVWASRDLGTTSADATRQGDKFAALQDLTKVQQQLADVQGTINGRIGRAESVVIELDEKVQRQWAAANDTLMHRIGH